MHANVATFVSSYSRSLFDFTCSRIMIANADIIFCIFKEYTSSTSGNLEEWKLQLPLLCVCRTWRIIGLPIVYSRLYITCSNNILPKELSLDTEAQNNYTQPIYVVSNMGLITLLGLESYAKTVYIVRLCPMNLYDYISQAIVVIEQYKDRWEHVSSLVLKTTPIVYPFNSDFGRVEIHNIFTFERLNQLANCVTTAMPNLVHICTNENNDMSLATVVANTIVSTMAPHIKCLNTKVFRYINARNFSRELTCLRLTFAPAAIQNIPKVCAPILKRLELYGVFHNFSWNSFCDDLYESCLEFANLEKFCIHFVKGADMLQHNSSMKAVLSKDFFTKLSFPKLQYFSVNNTATCCTLLRYANFPRILKYFEIFLSSSNCAKIWDVQFGSAEINGLAGFYANITGSIEPLDLSNRLFSNELYSKSSELVLEDSTLVADVRRVNWEHLQSLRIIVPLDFTKLLDIVTKLKNLESLFIESLLYVQGMTLALDAEVKKALTSPLAPINTSIKNMHLKLGFRSGADDICFMTVVRYLALRVPTLQQLKIGKEYSDKANEFVSIYNTAYPHLNSVVI